MKIYISYVKSVIKSYFLRNVMLTTCIKQQSQTQTVTSNSVFVSVAYAREEMTSFIWRFEY